MLCNNPCFRHPATVGRRFSARSARSTCARRREQKPTSIFETSTGLQVRIRKQFRRYFNILTSISAASHSMASRPMPETLGRPREHFRFGIDTMHLCEPPWRDGARTDQRRTAHAEASDLRAPSFWNRNACGQSFARNGELVCAAFA